MLNNYLYDFLSHVQCKNKGVPHTIQRSKGQSFLGQRISPVGKLSFKRIA